MTHLTYIIGFFAIVVVGRAFLSSNKEEVSIFEETNIQEAVQETTNSLVIPWNTIPDEVHIQETETLPLVFNEINTTSSKTDTSSLITNNGDLPFSINHNVVFFSQAPDGDRNLPRQEACEEASIALASYFMKNKNLTKEQMRKDILSLVDRQMELFGDYLHTTVEQTKQLYEDFYGWNTYIIDNPTVDDIKSALAQWYLVVAPFAGRKLGNPYYSGKWPIYHMMVLKWYDDTNFYTNDVGTRRGENYAYTYQTILDANHDRADNINQWAKRMLVITQ